MCEAEYRAKLTTPEEAVARVGEGSTLMHGLAMAEPPGLLAALGQRLRSGDLRSLEVHSFLPMGYVCEALLAPEVADCVEATTFFVSAGHRGMVQTGLNYFVPNHFHQVPRFISDHMVPDVMVTTVSPMNRAGFFSFGTANDYTSTAAREAKVLMVEVNEHMPRVFGSSLLHVSEVDLVVENHVPLPTVEIGSLQAEDRVIGRSITEMVPDGATIQLGWGSVPSAVGAFLKDHRDLGIHTELLVPAFVELIRSGAVTGRQKTLHPMKHVFTVAMGDGETLEFMNDNPAMESYPVSYTNHPAVIAQNDTMISINSVLEVDLLGQASAEFLGGHQFGGTGGQLDFVRGAYDSKGGKSILAFHATAKNGAISRIVPRLEPGVQITTPRTDTHWLVTEYGTANLKGKSTRDRALAIIELAHPDFRDDLLRAAEDMYLM